MIHCLFRKSFIYNNLWQEQCEHAVAAYNVVRNSKKFIGRQFSPSKKQASQSREPSSQELA
jgi:hypothetical protein